MKNPNQSAAIQTRIDENPVDDSFQKDPLKKVRNYDESPTENLVRNSKKFEQISQQSPHERDILTKDFQENLDLVIKKNLESGSYVLEQDGKNAKSERINMKK